MLDMGFLPDIQQIIALLPAKRQNLMFSATFSDDIRRLSGGDPARPGDGRGRPAQHGRRGRPPAGLPGRSRPQGGPAGPPDPQGRPAPGPRLHPDQAGRHAAGEPARPRGPRRRRDPLRPVAAGTDARARGLQERRDPGPRRDRRRGARARHRGPAGRRQLRASVEPAGLHPPDRPDRPGGRDGRGHLARLHRRDRPAARRPADAQAGDPVDRRGGVHPRPRRGAAAARGAGRSRPGQPGAPRASQAGAATGGRRERRRLIVGRSPTGRSPGTTRGTGADVPGRCQETVRRLRRRCRSGRPRHPGKKKPSMSSARMRSTA